MGNIQDQVGQAKIWWKSKTIIGTLLMVIPVIIKMVWPESEVDLTGAVDEVWLGAEGLAGYADSGWALIQQAVGFALALYGRLKAKVGIKPKAL